MIQNGVKQTRSFVKQTLFLVWEQKERGDSSYFETMREILNFFVSRIASAVYFNFGKVGGWDDREINEENRNREVAAVRIDPLPSLNVAGKSDDDIIHDFLGPTDRHERQIVHRFTLKRANPAKNYAKNLNIGINQW